MPKYLHLDCEMGGRELKFSLLTSYFLVTDENFNTLGELFLETKPDDGVYIVSGQGMSVNGINIQEHDKTAITYKAAKPLLFNFLKQQASGGHLIPVGHGVRGDIEHVQDKLISEGSWNQFCTYHYIDTSVVLQFLRGCDMMPLDTDGSVEALAEYFGVTILPKKLHDPYYDTHQTKLVLQAMIKFAKFPTFTDKSVKGPVHL